MQRILLVCFLFFTSHIIFGQTTPFVLKGALKHSRQELYPNIVKNVITKNLSVPLTDSTEELWQDAFAAMELISYKSPWADNKIYAAFSEIQTRSTEFQRALLELVFANYAGTFSTRVRSLLLETKNTKIFAMCAVYILQESKNINDRSFLEEKTKLRLANDPDNPILTQLIFQIKFIDAGFEKADLRYLFSKDFLPGNILMFSLQRKNRNYPGLVIVRDAAGNFMKEDGHLFSVPQLARSLSGLPGYLTNGNTPEGIFRMDGFDTSASSFIGPTTNIQLTMPFEYKASHFYRDSTMADSSWDLNHYKELLPTGLKNYIPLLQAYYAGAAGRNEIIAHGTMIDPAYYKSKTYYPFTPTQGCLCAREIWDDNTGLLKESDQQKLVNAIIRAGGPQGYAIVINLDDLQKAVDPAEITDFIPFLNQK